MVAAFSISFLLLALRVAAKPVPAVELEEATITTVVSSTLVLTASLIPPVLPGTLVSATYTYPIYTSYVTGTSTLACTTTRYSIIPVPTAVGAAEAPASVPEELQSAQIHVRQVSSTSSSSSAVVPTSTDVYVTSVVYASTTTVTSSFSQRPPYTYTAYSVTYLTETTPFSFQAYACANTLDVFYAIVTDTRTITASRSVYASTTTVCASPASTSAVTTSTHAAIKPRQTSSTTAVAATGSIATFSTTIHRTIYVYATATATLSGALTITGAVCPAST